MNIYRPAIAVLACILAVSLSGISLAQETQEKTPLPLEEGVEKEGSEYMEYAYGTVVSLDKNVGKITISEYDFETDTDTNIIYSIDANIKVENAASWKDIPVGSEVDIEYIVDEGGKKTATFITVYKEEPAE